MPRQNETIQTIVTKEHSHTPLHVTINNKGKVKKSLFHSASIEQIELVVDGQVAATMSYELHSNYLLIKETYIHSGYVNLTAALFEHAFKQSQLNGKNGNVQYEVLATNINKWKKYGFILKSEKDKKAMLYLPKEVVVSKCALFSINTQEHDPSLLTVSKGKVSMGNHSSKSIEKSETKSAKKPKAEKVVPGQHNASDVQELTSLHQKISNADVAIKSLSTIPLDNLYVCVNRLNPYIDAYIENTRKPSLNLFDFHGAAGRERALKYLSDWREVVAKQIISTYKVSLNNLVLRGAALTTQDLVGIFVDGMFELVEAAKNGVMTVEGNRHEHSLRMYLLAYASELNAVCNDKSANAINPFTHPITFSNHIAPASLEAYAETARVFAAKRSDGSALLAR